MTPIKTFKTFINEKLVVFGKKAYPKSDNILILAGGAGSGKGFVLNNLLGIEGKVFDVDKLKELALKSDKIKQKYPELVKLDLKNPEDVRKMHTVFKDMKLDTNSIDIFTKTIVSGNKKPNELPNIIFDVTLKDFKKLSDIVTRTDKLGYDKKNIHITWVLNDVTVASEQNKKRKRVVPEDILILTHEGVAQTMGSIIRMGDAIRKYMDGDIVIVFNSTKVDSVTGMSDTTIGSSDKGGFYIKDALYVKIKEQGKSCKTKDVLNSELLDKINRYTPIGIPNITTISENQIDWSQDKI